MVETIGDSLACLHRDNLAARMDWPEYVVELDCPAGPVFFVPTDEMAAKASHGKVCIGPTLGKGLALIWRIFPRSRVVEFREAREQTGAAAP